jgi:phosphoenolpyruvate phosphomutase
VTRTNRLKRLLQGSGTDFFMEAHNGLSARIVEEAGFEAIWGSGLSISASLGVRDSNEASWTQVLEVAELMADVTSIPILLDGDTGYGNFNSMRRLVKKLEQRGVAGVCIEDKLFPKRNSFTDGPQELADVDEFCGKLKAGRDAQSCADFCLVARTEALIAGQGMAEALRRGEAYRQAGADALVVHSKSQDAREILTFLGEWANRLPVVLVPTTYYRTPTEMFEQAGVSVIIWANHLLRSALTAMQHTARTIRAQRSLVSVEPGIASLQEVFRLQDEPELARAEERYLPKPRVRS